MSHDAQMAKVSREALSVLMELLASGNLEKYGCSSSVTRTRELLRHICSEASSILNLETETLSIEQLGRSGIRHVCDILKQAREIPGVEVELNISQVLDQREDKTRRPILKKEGA